MIASPEGFRAPPLKFAPVKSTILSKCWLRQLDGRDIAIGRCLIHVEILYQYRSEKGKEKRGGRGGGSLEHYGSYWKHFVLLEVVVRYEEILNARQRFASADRKSEVTKKPSLRLSIDRPPHRSRAIACTFAVAPNVFQPHPWEKGNQARA